MFYMDFAANMTNMWVDVRHFSVFSLIKDWPTPMPNVVQSFNIFFLVIVVAALAYITIKFMATPKFGRGARRNLEIVESISVGPQSFVHVVRVGGQYVLIGTTRSQVNLLTQIDQEHLKLPENTQGGGFESFFSRFQKRENGDEKGNDS